MFTWIQNKIFSRLHYWFSEQIDRTYQELHTQRLQKMAKNLPLELVEINKVLTILNNNSWAVHHLFKKVRHEKRYADAFLYFFYSFELTLKHLIISEMNLQNMTAILPNTKNRLMFFSVYGKKRMFEVLEGEFTAGALIKQFFSIFPNFVHKSDLWKINDERKYIIHNMLKKEMSEVNIEQSFEKFFQKSETAIKNVLKEFDSILAKRPQNFLEKLTEVFELKNRT